MTMQFTYHFATTIESFFGKISFKYGSMLGNCSIIFAFIPRWTEDFTCVTPDTFSLC